MKFNSIKCKKEALETRKRHLLRQNNGGKSPSDTTVLQGNVSELAVRDKLDYKIQLQNRNGKTLSPQRSCSGLLRGTESSHPGSRKNKATWKGWKESQLEWLGKCNGFSSAKTLKHMQTNENKRAWLHSLTKQRLKRDMTSPNKCTRKINIGEEKELFKLKAKVSKGHL